MAEDFGAHDRIACPKCGGAMTVVRRSPDAERGAKYELQKLECGVCHHAATRVVDANGKPPAR